MVQSQFVKVLEFSGNADQLTAYVNDAIAHLSPAPAAGSDVSANISGSFGRWLVILSYRTA